MSQTGMANARAQTRMRLVASAVAALPTFDLSRPLGRVAKENPDWDAARLRTAEQEYRAFLRDCKQSPGVSLTPTRDADKVWHAHILHTRQYAEDCRRYCGRFVHHNPLEGEQVVGAECCRPCESDPNELN